MKFLLFAITLANSVFSGFATMSYMWGELIFNQTIFNTCSTGDIAYLDASVPVAVQCVSSAIAKNVTLSYPPTRRERKLTTNCISTCQNGCDLCRMWNCNTAYCGARRRLGESFHQDVEMAKNHERRLECGVEQGWRDNQAVQQFTPCFNSAIQNSGMAALCVQFLQINTAIHFYAEVN